MDASFFIIMFFVFVGVLSVIKFLSNTTNNGSIRTEENSSTFQSIKSVLFPIGSFKATQYINDISLVFDCPMEYDESDNTLTVLIDGRNAAIKMKLDKLRRNYLIEIINKAMEWNSKAMEASLTANKLISKINTDVSLIVGEELYISKNSNISFNFYNNSDDPTGCSIMVISNIYDIGRISIPASVIFIRNDEFGKIKSLLSEEYIQSLRNERIEKNKIVDTILN